jgi:hypothetical protein
LNGERHRTSFPPERAGEPSRIFENDAFAATTGDLARQSAKNWPATFVKDVF